MGSVAYRLVIMTSPSSVERMFVPTFSRLRRGGFDPRIGREIPQVGDGSNCGTVVGVVGIQWGGLAERHRNEVKDCPAPLGQVMPRAVCNADIVGSLVPDGQATVLRDRPSEVAGQQDCRLVEVRLLAAFCVAECIAARWRVQDWLDVLVDIKGGQGGGGVHVDERVALDLGNGHLSGAQKLRDGGRQRGLVTARVVWILDVVQQLSRAVVGSQPGERFQQRTMQRGCEVSDHVAIHDARSWIVVPVGTRVFSYRRKGRRVPVDTTETLAGNGGVGSRLTLR